MDESPITLDDGELWIPSDIFPNDDSPIDESHPFTPSNSSLDSLGRQFGNLGFVDRPPRPPYYREEVGRFRSEAQNIVISHMPNGQYGLTVSPPVYQGFLNFLSTDPRFAIPIRPIFRRNFEPQVPPRIARQIMARTRRANAMHMHGQLNRPLNPAAFQLDHSWSNSLIGDSRRSISGTGVFIRRSIPSTGVFIRPSIFGTGVFIPRAIVPSIRPHNFERNQTGLTFQEAAPNAFEIGRPGEYYHQPINHPQVSLPNDWTY